MKDVSVIEDKIVVKVEDLIKIHLFIKLVEGSVLQEFSSRELNILTHLYTYGGVTDKESICAFAEDCFNNNLCEKNSLQSVRNVLGKAREHGIVKRRKSNNWRISDSFLPKLDTEHFVFKYFLTDVQ